MQSRRILAAVLGLGLFVGALAAPAAENNQGVIVDVAPFGQPHVWDEAVAPESPLVAEVSAGSAGNVGWGRAVPGSLKLTAAIVNGPDPWSQTHCVARFSDHYRLSNPQMGQDARGVFFFRFVLTGTMRILASDWQSGASVAVTAYRYGSSSGGMLTFYRVGSTPTLYGLSGDGGSFPENNMFANPDGSMKVYATATTPVDGYYEVRVNVPVAFALADFPVNRDASLDDWLNWLEIELSVGAMRAANCDFSSTFAFAGQNPIVPDPMAPGQPVLGWQYSCASGEIALPTVTTVATTTGTGEAAFVPDRGVMAGLTGLTLADFPAGLSEGNFAHGWFGLDVNGFEPGEMVVVGISLPAAVPPAAQWWYHDGARWEALSLYDDDGDAFLALMVNDNGPGDLDPADGALTLRGGLSAEVPLPTLPAAFTALWRGGGVDLAWRAPGVDPEALRLTATRGDEGWTVPVRGDGRGNFQARDEAAPLRGGGVVRYDLALDGVLLESRTVEVAVPSVPALLVGIAPNPCNPRAEVTFLVTRAADLELAVFDLAGRRVTDLAGGRWEAGEHVVTWRGEDAAGRALPSGTYVVRLLTEQGQQTAKLSLVR